VFSLGPMRIPKATAWLAGACLGVYVLQQLPGVGPWLRGGVYLTQGGARLDPGVAALVPSLVFTAGQVWRLATYVFIHGSPGHLLFNLITLWFCGLHLEPYLGTRRFLVYFAAGGIGAGLFSTFMWHSTIIGASGAVLALLAAFAWYFPHAQILLFFVIPVPARVFVLVAALMSVLFAVSGTGGNVAHLAHLGGILVGIACVKIDPAVQRWYAEFRARQDEELRRAAAEDRARDERFFRERIDPLLKKISDKGMDSLTRAEKKLLFSASRKHRGRFGNERIVPHDFK
jgi:membrane associated rhomboid family serine protease